MADDRPLESRRELENLRQRYQEHRRTIRHLLQTAPDERLAARYEATLTELQKSIDQLDRIDREANVEQRQPEFDPNETRSVRPSAAPVLPGVGTADTTRSFEDAEFPTQERSWNDPVVRDESDLAARDQRPGSGGNSVVAWIAGIIILVALVIGAFLFWPESDEAAEDDLATSETVVEDAVAEPEPPPAILAVEPSTYDYGIIQKGTRSVHRFTLRNRTDQVLPISVGRSECRCLWYEYPPEIPAGESVELAITVDGARAEAGVLSETVVLTSEANPEARAELDLTADIAAQ